MKFKMNGIEYKIKEVSQKEYKLYRKSEDEKTGCKITDIEDGVYFGASHHYVNTVYLDESLSLDRKRKVLIHELTHCYISEYITHESHNFNEEMVADICANSYDIITNIVNKYFKEK